MPQVFVGIGSNVDREASVRAGVQALRAAFGELLLSSVYESEAVGFTGDAFYNLVAGFHSEAPIAEVVEILADIEQRCGRRRGSDKFAPRTLDLDLLLYGDAVVDEGRLQLPRDEITRYAFVLWPLAEIAPAMRHPQRKETFGELWTSFDKSGPALRPIEFQW